MQELSAACPCPHPQPGALSPVPCHLLYPSWPYLEPVTQRGWGRDKWLPAADAGTQGGNAG